MDAPQPHTKKCPYCAEEIQAEAVKCRFCGQWFTQQQQPPMSAAPRPAPAPTPAPVAVPRPAATPASSRGGESRERPPAVTVLAVLFFVSAAVDTVGNSVLPGLGAARVLLVITVPLYFAAGWGLWKLLEWGRVLALVLAVVAGVFSLFGLFAALAYSNIGGVLMNVGGLGFSGALIFFLMRPEIKRAFGQYAAPQAATYSIPQQGQPTTVRPPAAVQEPTAPSNAPTGLVTVISTPEGADVSVDGDFVGDTPSTLKLARGKYSIKVSMAGYKDWGREISVLAGSEVKLTATLER